MQDYIRDGYLSTRQEPNTVGANEYATAGEVRIVDWYQNTIDMMRSMP
jgi:hypothetical protein